MDISMATMSLPAVQRRLDHLLDGRLLGWTEAEEQEYLLLCASEAQLLLSPEPCRVLHQPRRIAGRGSSGCSHRGVGDGQHD